MLELFIKGGPVMWPILILSLITLAVVVERILFLIAEKRNRNPHIVEQILRDVEHSHLEKACEKAAKSKDVIAKILRHGLQHRETSLSNALLQAASRELARYNQGLVVLDTAVTLGPLLGLLGTVTGMIHAFGLLGSTSIAQKQMVITGGVAEALIAVAFGLIVAIVALIPFNYFNDLMETIRREIEDAANHLEITLAGHNYSNPK